MYAITGASGNTGSKVAEALLGHGAKVRVIGRDTNRLARFAGADPFAADLTDADAVSKAFDGARAVYVMLPPNPSSPDVRAYQERVSDALASALKKTSATHVVVLSSIGADKSEKNGPVVGLHNLEQKVNSIVGLNALHLRAGYFMENLLPQVGVIRNLGILAGPVRADLRLPMIATRDIGAAATDALLNPSVHGKQTRELLGQRDLTYTEVATIIGQAIGKPGLKYIQAPDDQFRSVLVQMGMSEQFAKLLLEMIGSLNSGYMSPLEPRSRQNTTPTSYETFVADTFVPSYQQQAAA